MRTLALQTTLVAALAVGSVSAPVDDEGQTNSTATITIPVLLNDPGDQTLVSVGSPSSGVATVTIVGEQIEYSPNGFVGNDNFTYTTDCGTANVVVAVTPNVPLQTDRPRDDFAATPLDTPVNIVVLANDPQGSRMTSIVAPGPSNGTAVIVDNPPAPPPGVGATAPGIVYTPNPGFLGTDTFQYTTQGGTATVTVVVSNSAANPIGPPQDDADTTDLITPINIPVLANDPVGSEILAVNDFVVLLGNTTRTIGRVELNGNEIRYTPNTNLQSIGDIDRFSYTTQSGTAIVTVTIGAPSGAGTLGQVILNNQSSFNVRFRIIAPDPPATFFDNCDNAFPLGFVDVGTMTMEPMTSMTLCVGLGQSSAGLNVLFEVEIQGANPTPPNSVATNSCFVAPLPAAATTVNIVDRTTLIGNPPAVNIIGIQFGACQ